MIDHTSKVSLSHSGQQTLSVLVEWLQPSERPGMLVFHTVKKRISTINSHILFVSKHYETITVAALYWVNIYLYFGISIEAHWTDPRLEIFKNRVLKSAVACANYCSSEPVRTSKKLSKHHTSHS